jgi:hypothetical protein
MFQVPRNRKFYKERKDNTITREDDVKLFHFRNESVQWIADFLGNDDEETWCFIFGDENKNIVAICG